MDQDKKQLNKIWPSKAKCSFEQSVWASVSQREEGGSSGFFMQNSFRWLYDRKLYPSPPASSGERVPWPRPTHQPDLQNHVPRARRPQAGYQAAIHQPIINLPPETGTHRHPKLRSTHCLPWGLEYEHSVPLTSDGEILWMRHYNLQ